MAKKWLQTRWKTLASLSKAYATTGEASDISYVGGRSYTADKEVSTVTDEAVMVFRG